MLTLFKQAWKGEASLVKAFWLIYFVFGIIVGIIISIPFAIFAPDFSYNTYNHVVMTIAFPYTLFSAICVWQCAKNTSLMLWNILAKVIVVIAVISSIISILHVLHIF